MERLTKTYSDGTHGAADNLPCGENSYEYKGLLLEALGKYEDAEEQGESPARTTGRCGKVFVGRWEDHMAESIRGGHARGRSSNERERSD